MPSPEPRPDEEAEGAAVRSRRPDEARDFTPWLADHLDLLGEELGMGLEFVAQEHPVGQLSLDILARDTGAGVLVAIENQLESSDDAHLGRLLAYATGCGAGTPVWVATDFRREYATALHRLNEWTRDGIHFYAVMIELVRQTDDPEFRPRFRKVVYPGGWDEALTPTGPPISPDAQRHRDFFEPLIAELRRSGFADRAVQYIGYTGRRFPSRLDGVDYSVSLDREGAWVTLHIATGEGRGPSASSTSWRPTANGSRRASTPTPPRSGTGAGTMRTPSPPSTSGGTASSTTRRSNWSRPASGCSTCSRGSSTSSTRGWRGSCPGWPRPTQRSGGAPWQNARHERGRPRLRP